MGQQVQINKQGISSKISHEGGRGGSLASTAKWAHVIVLIVTSSWNFWLYLLISSVWDVWVFVFHRDRKVEGTYTRCLFGGTFMVGGGANFSGGTQLPFSRSTCMIYRNLSFGLAKTLN